MNMKKLALVGTYLALAVGCGGSVVDNMGGGGTGGSGGGKQACSAFDDEEGQSSVTLHMRNDTTMPIFVRGDCQGEATFTMHQDGGGDPSTGFPFDPGCLQTCEGFQTQPQFICGACAPAVIRIEPGGTHDEVWNGTGLRSGLLMPSLCWFESPHVETCSKVVTAPAGTWTASVTAFSDCGDGCTCDANGSCFGTATGLSATVTSASFAYPTTNSVDVVFDVCAFGCAD
ncbi:Hypothetical protein A7982_06831 [Minicystis rosea]|nr:Hypothetical protein A7982_06831 [Minicystis rosea]